MRETLARSETHVKIAQSPSYSLEDDRNNSLANPDSSIMEVDRGESGPGASVSTEQVAPVSKRESMGWPPTSY